MAQRIIIPALNYDQQSMPTNPAIGQVWRERDSSNGVLQTWFWNGTYWLSVETKIISTPSQTTGSTNTTIVNFNSPSNLFVEGFTAIGQLAGAISPGGATDSNTNYWVCSCATLGGGGAVNSYSQTISLQGLTYLATNNIYRQSAPINSIVTISQVATDNTINPRQFYCFFTKIGTPPNLNGIQLNIQHRLFHS